MRFFKLIKQFLLRFNVYLISLGIITLFVSLFLVYKKEKSLPAIASKFDLYEIKKRGKIIAVLDKNSIDYYAFKGRPMGFQLDLLRMFSRFLKLPLEVIVEDNYAKSLQMLGTAKCDIIATNFTILKEQKKHFTFSEPIIQTRQVLIQRKKNKEGTPFIKSALDLAQKTIYVKTGSAFQNRLISLSEEIGDTIYIKNEVGYSSEMLIKLVSEGKIDYTVANENVAKINASYFSNIDYSVPVSLEQNTAWVIRKNTPIFEYLVNNWIRRIKRDRYFTDIYHKYFESETQVSLFKNEYSSFNGNKISVFDKSIKKFSSIIGWDWRLLASLIYQESKFKSDTISQRGAFGLMQMMPATAQLFEVDSSSSPEDNIRAGILYIKWLDHQFISRVEHQEERIKFILAAYNIGLGHIFDAQALAQEYGRDNQKWDNSVDYYLLNKSNPIFLNDSLVRNGSTKGRETLAMVRKIMERYHHYKNLIAE